MIVKTAPLVRAPDRVMLPAAPASNVKSLESALIVELNKMLPAPEPVSIVELPVRVTAPPNVILSSEVVMLPPIVVVFILEVLEDLANFNYFQKMFLKCISSRRTHYISKH